MTTFLGSDPFVYKIKIPVPGLPGWQVIPDDPPRLRRPFPLPGGGQGYLDWPIKIDPILPPTVGGDWPKRLDPFEGSIGGSFTHGRGGEVHYNFGFKLVIPF